jgi:excisionase family DNA binding protein
MPSSKIGATGPDKEQPEQSKAAPAAYLIGKAELARRYSVSRRTIQTWVAQRRIPFVRIGNTLRFNPRACDNAMARFSVKELSMTETRPTQMSKKRASKQEAGK